MKKLTTITIILLILAAVFGLTLHQTSIRMQDQSPVIARALDFLSPAIAYADSDTVRGPGPIEPPPPPIW